MYDQETIVAPATAIGDGGINILRISGKTAFSCLKKVFRPSRSGSNFSSHRLYHGYITAPDGEILDEVMAVFMQAPRTYTREDVAEIHCHGGALVTRRILDRLIEPGIRLARPGEFTLRAFLNGRIDLSQAEGVIEVIRAQSDRACQLAVGQLAGRLSALTGRMREDLLDSLALLESWIDFPEEDIDHEDLDQIGAGLDGIQRRIHTLVETFEEGRIVRDGARVLILGKPNVGKSSLLNALLGESRAIVTDLPGTTRDTIEEGVFLDGIRLRLIDTAGVRVTEDVIEREGVKRATEKISEADLVLLVVDGSLPLDGDDLAARELCPVEKILLVRNKKDLGRAPLPAPFSSLPGIELSVQTDEGLDVLKNAIVRFFQKSGGREAREDVIITDRRHRDALVRAGRLLQNGIDGLQEGVPAELIAVELYEALSALGEITGESTPEDVLNRIFERFCIGK